MQLSSSACDKAKQMTEETHKVAATIGGGAGAKLGSLGSGVTSAADALNTTAQVFQLSSFATLKTISSYPVGLELAFLPNRELRRVTEALEILLRVFFYAFLLQFKTWAQGHWKNMEIKLKNIVRFSALDLVLILLTIASVVFHNKK